MQPLSAIAQNFQAHVPREIAWSLRLVEEESESLEVRQGVVEPSHLNLSRGAMVTVVEQGGMGYGATADLSIRGLAAATARARRWAALHASLGLFSADWLPLGAQHAQYASPVREAWDQWSLAAKIELLEEANAALACDERIVDWAAWLSRRRVKQLLITSAGGEILQELDYVNPGLVAVANVGSQTQRRHGGGHDRSRQGGMEQIDELQFLAAAPRVADEALALLGAPECPSDTRDVILLPGQMALQIHESIGHPLELDRILGDERNYAGTSFVTPDMFGQYRYGSALLNVTFDPTLERELMSLAADDDGTLAERNYLIKDGILLRPLGGALSQQRAGLPGTACSRAAHWDRPPIDRMGNINLEPGDSSLDDLIAGVERGILMDTNRSWSIDDSRNKFQFGCEWARLIVDGELTDLVRNPNYRGISAEFWRSLDGVGDVGTREVCAVYSCGKGEPNQSVYVGHAAPACRFRAVEVFGGEA